MKKATVICVNMKILTYIYLESEKDKREKKFEADIYIWRNDWKFSKCIKRHWCKETSTLANPSKINTKKKDLDEWSSNYSKDKKKFLKEPRGKNTQNIHTWEQWYKLCLTSHHKKK